MSGGGGKSGSEVEETSIPEWIKQPAIRNLQRAEDVQRIEYMPYRGPEVAGFTPSQISAFQNNLDTAKAFGLAAPGSVMDGIPTPSTFAGGVSGYSTMPLYEEALAETTAAQPDAVAQYNALFGSDVGTTAKPNPSPNGIASLGGGSGGGSKDLTYQEQLDEINKIKENQNYFGAISMKDDTSPFTTDYPVSTVSTPPNLSSRLDSKGYTPSYDDIVKEVKQKQMEEAMSSYGTRGTPRYISSGNPHMGK
jgi:hypothetical protein